MLTAIEKSSKFVMKGMKACSPGALKHKMADNVH